MRLFQIGTLILVSGLTVVGFQNCAQRGQLTSTQDAASDSAAREKMENLELQIKTLSARDLSCAADADCAVVSVGSSHCGLPTFQVLSSKLSGDHKNVVALAESFGEIEDSVIKAKDGTMYSCGASLLSAPTCVAHVCTARP